MLKVEEKSITNDAVLDQLMARVSRHNTDYVTTLKEVSNCLTALRLDFENVKAVLAASAEWQRNHDKKESHIFSRAWEIFSGVCTPLSVMLLAYIATRIAGH